MAPKTPQKSVKSPKSPKSPKTPKQSKKGSNSSSPSPRRSPGSSQLSDVARRCTDCCASWHEVTNKWAGFNDLGTSVANKLVNLQLQKQYSESDNSGMILSDLTQGSPSNLEEEIVKTSQELSSIHQSLGALHNKMKNLRSSFEAIRELRSLESIGERQNCQNEPIFQTWTADEFCAASEKLLVMYEKELALKEKLIHEFTRTEDRQALLVFISIWLHEPYLEDCHQMLLDSMLIETGLK